MFLVCRTGPSNGYRCTGRPIALLEGRQAISFRGHGLGGALLGHAAERARRSDVAVFALVVDAKDESAASFYNRHSLMTFGATGGTLLLPP